MRVGLDSFSRFPLIPPAGPREDQPERMRLINETATGQFRESVCHERHPQVKASRRKFILWD
jgi:hypothetical protein